MGVMTAVHSLLVMQTLVSVSNKRTAFFQQLAFNAEAVSNSWNFNAYALVPIGDTEQLLNSFYQGGALDTYGLDIGYFITPVVNASVGYYYQNGDLGSADGSGVLGRVAYEVSSGLTAGVNISYDKEFETRVSADLKVRFGGPATTAQRTDVQQLPVINALTLSPSNRDIRVHDGWDMCFQSEYCAKAYGCSYSENASERVNQPHAICTVSAHQNLSMESAVNF